MQHETRQNAQQARQPMLGAGVVPLVSSPAQQQMDIQTLQAKTPPEVGILFASRGYADYGHLFEQHNINGARLLALTPADLKEMGFAKVGDRLGIQQEIATMKTTARQMWRNAIIQEHEEIYPHNVCMKMFHTCCGACPPQMDHYKLTSTQLKITHNRSPTCCGRKWTCLGVRVENDMHPLNQIVDVDTTNVQDGLCALRMTQVTCHLSAMSQGDGVGGRESNFVGRPTAEMVVGQDVGEAFAEQIRNQIEEYKRKDSFVPGLATVA